jgi:uncharacterized membrane protein YjfL (UPF0719 family)
MVGSLTTFLGSGGIILGLIILEKFGVKINHSLVRYLCLGVCVYGFVVLLLKFLPFLG